MLVYLLLDPFSSHGGAMGFWGLASRLLCYKGKVGHTFKYYIRTYVLTLLDRGILELRMKSLLYFLDQS